MLALPAPFGWPEGLGISIQAPGPADGSAVAEIVRGYGCPSFIARKVASAMSASGRYDCRVTLSPHAIEMLRGQLSEVDVQVALTDGQAHDAEC
jgi:hypothetical protein